MIKRVLFITLVIGIPVLLYYILYSYQIYQKLLLLGQTSQSKLSSILLDFPEEVSFPLNNPVSLLSQLLNQAQQILTHDIKFIENSLLQSKKNSVVSMESEIDTQPMFYYVETNLSDLIVISYARKGHIPTQKASMITPCISPTHLFEFMTSVDGYAIIDPITPREEHNRPPLYYHLAKDGTTLDIREVIPNIPGAKRMFLVANVLDPKNMLFISQSVNFPYEKFQSKTIDMPINFIPNDPPLPSLDRNTTKAYNTFGLKVLDSFIDTDGETKCRVESFDTATGLPFPLFITHLINSKMFYPGLHANMVKTMTALAKQNKLAKESKENKENNPKEL